LNSTPTELVEIYADEYIENLYFTNSPSLMKSTNVFSPMSSSSKSPSMSSTSSPLMSIINSPQSSKPFAPFSPNIAFEGILKFASRRPPPPSTNIFHPQYPREMSQRDYERLRHRIATSDPDMDISDYSANDLHRMAQRYPRRIMSPILPPPPSPPQIPGSREKTQSDYDREEAMMLQDLHHGNPRQVSPPLPSPFTSSTPTQPPPLPLPRTRAEEIRWRREANTPAPTSRPYSPLPPIREFDDDGPPPQRILTGEEAVRWGRKFITSSPPPPPSIRNDRDEQWFRENVSIPAAGPAVPYPSSSSSFDDNPPSTVLDYIPRRLWPPTVVSREVHPDLSPGYLKPRPPTRRRTVGESMTTSNSSSFVNVLTPSSSRFVHPFSSSTPFSISAQPIYRFNDFYSSLSSEHPFASMNSIGEFSSMNHPLMSSSSSSFPLMSSSSSVSSFFPYGNGLLGPYAPKIDKLPLPTGITEAYPLNVGRKTIQQIYRIPNIWKNRIAQIFNKYTNDFVKSYSFLPLLQPGFFKEETQDISRPLISQRLMKNLPFRGQAGFSNYFLRTGMNTTPIVYRKKSLLPTKRPNPDVLISYMLFHYFHSTNENRPPVVNKRRHPYSQELIDYIEARTSEILEDRPFNYIVENDYKIEPRDSEMNQHGVFKDGNYEAYIVDKPYTSEATLMDPSPVTSIGETTAMNTDDESMNENPPANDIDDEIDEEFGITNIYDNQQFTTIDNEQRIIPLTSVSDNAIDYSASPNITEGRTPDGALVISKPNSMINIYGESVNIHRSIVDYFYYGGPNILDFTHVGLEQYPLAERYERIVPSIVPAPYPLFNDSTFGNIYNTPFGDVISLKAATDYYRNDDMNQITKINLTPKKLTLFEKYSNHIAKRFVTRGRLKTQCFASEYPPFLKFYNIPWKTLAGQPTMVLEMLNAINRYLQPIYRLPKISFHTAMERQTIEAIDEVQRFDEEEIDYSGYQSVPSLVKDISNYGFKSYREKPWERYSYRERGYNRVNLVTVRFHREGVNFKGFPPIPPSVVNQIVNFESKIVEQDYQGFKMRLPPVAASINISFPNLETSIDSTYYKKSPLPITGLTYYKLPMVKITSMSSNSSSSSMNSTSSSTISPMQLLRRQTPIRALLTTRDSISLKEIRQYINYKPSARTETIDSPTMKWWLDNLPLFPKIEEPNLNKLREEFTIRHMAIEEAFRGDIQTKHLLKGIVFMSMLECINTSRHLQNRTNKISNIPHFLDFTNKLKLTGIETKAFYDRIRYFHRLGITQSDALLEDINNLEREFGMKLSTPIDLYRYLNVSEKVTLNESVTLFGENHEFVWDNNETFKPNRVTMENALKASLPMSIYNEDLTKVTAGDREFGILHYPVRPPSLRIVFTNNERFTMNPKFAELVNIPNQSRTIDSFYNITTNPRHDSFERVTEVYDEDIIRFPRLV